MIVSNDPELWPLIDLYRVASYFVVASSTAMVYDWVLTFGQEFELIWMQRWSLMTFLYLSVRYLGIVYSIGNLLCMSSHIDFVSSDQSRVASIPSVSMTDVVSNIMTFALLWTSIIVNILLGVIMITRLYAMYQGSKRILIFIVTIFMAITIISVVLNAIGSSYISGEEVVFSGTHQCITGGSQPLISETWILGTVWEVVALSLAVWIVVKHFRELRRSSKGWATDDCFMVLIKTHVLYFVGFTAVSCIDLGLLSPVLRPIYYESSGLLWHPSDCHIHAVVCDGTTPCP
ncbi:hypothetical protein K503DRAFT_603983 [Rhizopogon vinicolor AM-OR11-026]|uniref:DUF6533 domain-containing protein n=1 Tax=Rhizopogon vinicolor AM-OR11-026 TaxID=1314800 RepID=A0A1B7N6N0_9AGAM|nr:hypothetical protein K503DRAFT_603983 [Rhizopogon vinicolor AM-OR11-026]